MPIHPLAVVDPAVKLGRDVHIGPFCVIEADVSIGDRCTIGSHSVIKQGTTLGTDNQIAEAAIIGGLPQHAHAPEQSGRLIIGSHNTLRENVTIHRALQPDQATTIGDHNLLMVGAHVAHDCVVGNHTIFANNATLGGHVVVQDRAFLSGSVAVHQFCRIGAVSMSGGVTGITRDVLPYVLIDGRTCFVVGLNTVGLRRAGFSSDDLLQLKRAYRVIYRSGLKWTEILDKLRTEFTTGPAAVYYDFLATSKRGIIAERRLPPAAKTATIKLPEDAGEEPPLRKAG